MCPKHQVSNDMKRNKTQSHSTLLALIITNLFLELNTKAIVHAIEELELWK